MSKFIWDKRDGVHVFDLAKTAKCLKDACEFLYQAAAEGKRIVIVGTKRQAADIVAEEAKKANVAYVSTRWLGGTITNWKQIKGRIDKLNKMKEDREQGEFKKYTKKEQVLIDRQINRLERFLGGLTKLEGEPEVLVVIDTHKERSAVREAKSKNLTVVGMVDSNADPETVDFPIPANDDAVRSIKLVVEKLVGAIDAGLSQRAKNK